MKLLKTCLMAGLVASMSSSAMAVSTSDLKLPFLKQNNVPKRSDTPVKDPIRLAKYKAMLVKVWTEKQPDGTFKSKEEKVCELTGDVPVFEISENDSFRWDIPFPTCETNLKNGKATISFYTYIMQIRDYSDPFRPGTRVPLKAFGAGLTAVSGEGTRVTFATPNFVGTEDFGTKDLTILTTVDRLSDDSDNGVLLNEEVRALVKIED